MRKPTIVSPGTLRKRLNAAAWRPGRTPLVEVSRVSVAQRLAVEWGYKQCEKGESLQGALANFEKLMTMPIDQIIRPTRPPYAVAKLRRPAGACYCDFDDEECYRRGHWEAIT